MTTTQPSVLAGQHSTRTCLGIPGMWTAVRKLLFYFGWALKPGADRQRIPLTASLILTDQCNLQCRHCTVSRLGYERSTFAKVTADVTTLYELGARMLVITGGEPMLWRDGNRNVADVVAFARRLGFFRVVICTNGTFPLDSNADYLWISLDGYAEQHEKLRGDVYSLVLDNIASAVHKNLFVNFTVSRINHRSFENAAEELFRNPKIRGILFLLFTPYIGCDRSLMLSPAERAVVVNRIKAIKRKHPIGVTNTFDGLESLADNRWDRPVTSSVVINRGEQTGCCCRNGITDRWVCENCGCTPAIETFVLERMKPLAILENLRFL